MRNESCPLCGQKCDSILALRFKAKMNLPTEFAIRHCASDNFLFVDAGDQSAYDDYYASLSNDSYHTEMSRGELHSPIAVLQKDRLVERLPGFFDTPQKVFDFGCGEASLLLELALEFTTSEFFGYDPSPAADVGNLKATRYALSNLCVSRIYKRTPSDRFDLVIVSHVIEHLIEFNLFRIWSDLLTDGGLLYVEVPNSLHYAERARREFLYYFDRLHVNHFTPQSLVRLAASYGFSYSDHLEYAFPYRDEGEYPVMGVLFRKGGTPFNITSPNVSDVAEDYIAREKLRAEKIASQFEPFEGLLVWGAGDNFHRSIENGGPLSRLRNLIVLDRAPQVIQLGGRQYPTRKPSDGLKAHPWPVAITISEGKNEIVNQVRQVDPNRLIFCI